MLGRVATTLGPPPKCRASIALYGANSFGQPPARGARDQFGSLTCSAGARRPLFPTKRAVLRGANISEWCAASCDDETGVPTGRSTSGWRLERVGVHASTLKQPRDQ